MNKFTQKISGQEQAIRHFLRDYLNKPIAGQMPHSILADIGRYYDADRSYIFKLNENCTKACRTQVDRMQIIQSLSEIYTSVYYIDLAHNHFTELSSI